MAKFDISLLYLRVGDQICTMLAMKRWVTLMILFFFVCTVFVLVIFYMMECVQLILGLFELRSQSCNLFLIAFSTFFHLDLKKCEFFHSFLCALFVLVQSCFGGSKLILSSFTSFYKFSLIFSSSITFFSSSINLLLNCSLSFLVN